MLDEIHLSNHSGERVEIRMALDCAADFRDLFEARGYARTSRMGDVSETVEGEALRFAYRYGGLRRGGFRRATTVRVSGDGAEPEAEPGRISFGVGIEPGESREFSVSVTLEESGEAVREDWREAGALYGDAPALRTDWKILRRCWERSLEDLESLSFDAGGGLLVPAAGSPWYMALFGRDALITGYQTMLLGAEPAKNTLRALARHQATERDDFTDAEAGKIPHELRRGELAFFGEIAQTPYYGTADATPLFLILLNEVWRWTDETEFVREMEDPARRALAWVLDHSDKVNGYVAYQSRSSAGLENLSWKDSASSMLFRDGTRAEGPIAPCEVQGYVYDALLRTAELAEQVWIDSELAADLRRHAGILKARFNEDFWMEDRGYYALALDGNGRRIDSITSNPGHLLWSGIVSGGRARTVADLLMGRDLFSGWGIRTMAEGEAGYDPESYHNGSVWPHDNAIIVQGLQRYGFRREAAHLTTALLEAAPHFGDRLPEVFAGYSRNERREPVEYATSCIPQAWAAGTIPLLVRAMLGVEPDRERRTLLSEPVLPDGVTKLRLDGVRAFGERHTLPG